MDNIFARCLVVSALALAATAQPPPGPSYDPYGYNCANNEANAQWHRYNNGQHGPPQPPFGFGPQHHVAHANHTRQHHLPPPTQQQHQVQQWNAYEQPGYHQQQVQSMLNGYPATQPVPAGPYFAPQAPPVRFSSPNESFNLFNLFNLFP
jgi:hypothetical protein